MIGIIAAIDEEVNTLINHANVINIETDHMITFYHLVIGKQHVILAKSGAGKVNASMTVTKMIGKYAPKYIINTGVAGGVDALEVGSLVIGDSVVYHDVNMSSYRHKLSHGQIGGLPLEFKTDGDLAAKFQRFCTDKKIISHIGTIATGDCFVSDIKCLENIMKEIPRIAAVDMESAAIAQVCHLHDIPFLPVRIISDRVTETYEEDEFSLNINKACAALGKKLIEYISME